MINGTRYFEKKQWKDMLWSRAWDIENRDWEIRTTLFKSNKLLSATMGSIKQLIWWQLGDMFPKIIQPCENVAKISLLSSLLGVSIVKQFRVCFH